MTRAADPVQAWNSNAETNRRCPAARKRLIEKVTKIGLNILNLLRASRVSIRQVLFIAIAVASSTASAHSGGLNAAGCHNDRKNGGYHCHRGPVREVLPLRQSSAGSAYYPNCASARAVGAAPIRVGEPGYRAGLDRDRDGVACE